MKEKDKCLFIMILGLLMMNVIQFVLINKLEERVIVLEKNLNNELEK